MYIIVLFIIACLLGRVFWQKLVYTRLNLPARVILTLLFAGGVFIALSWLAVLLSIYGFQINDPITG